MRVKSYNEYYKVVSVQFYLHFVQKQLKNFDFKFQLLHILSFHDLVNTQGIKQCLFDQVNDILPATFDKAAVKIEYSKFVVDSDVHCTEGDTIKFCSICTI